MGTRVRFVKGHGTENDFVVLPDLDGELTLTPEWVAAICNRRTGIGADGVLRVVPTVPAEFAAYAPQARWFMDYRNADGSPAQMCGNGIRVFARYLVDHCLEAPGEFAIATRGGVRTVRLQAFGDVSVDMGVAAFPQRGPVTVRVGVRAWPAVAVSIPNPHAVAYIEDLTQAGDLRAAPLVEPASAFPEGVNVEFVVSRGPQHVAMRVHERGVGETRSCGTGACAVMVASARRDGAAAPVTYRVDVPGGTLHISELADGHVEMTGPAELVAEGELLPFSVGGGRDSRATLAG